MEPFASFEKLEELNLRGRKLTDLGMGALGRMKNLRALDLSETGVSSEGIAKLSSLAALRRIGLAELKRVDDAAVAHLAHLKNLEQLDISGTGVSDASLVQIAALPNLKRLYAGGSKVSQNGAELFKKERPQVHVSWYVPPRIATPPQGPPQRKQRPETKK
jgi:Leucine-rich repeat (LRR) protein